MKDQAVRVSGEYSDEAVFVKRKVMDGGDFKLDHGEQTHALPPISYYLGIFAISSAVLLFEVSLTRIFAVILWAHLAFMVVGTALFGFGLSGVYLALRTGKASDSRDKLAWFTLCAAIAMVVAYAVINTVPFQMWNFEAEPINYLYLAVWYVALVVPFFFAGLVVAGLLGSYPSRAARLYGFDLLGAALGSMLFIPAIGLLNGEGLVFLAAAICSLSAVMLSRKGQRLAQAVAGIAAVSLLIFSFSASAAFPVQQHQSKRGFDRQVKESLIMKTLWSPISRVDLAQMGEKYLNLWIDGGTNESAIMRWSGDLATLAPQNWSSIATAYNLRSGTDFKALVIGSSGGKEVLFALSHGARQVDAVEMDPSIAKLTSEPYVKEFMGNLYQNPKVQFSNDEGRSYLRRQPKESYDIIQFVNNYTPVAMASGALNLSETFLITVESFHDFLDHLSPNGIVALHRGATLRVGITAMEALRQRGVENPASHIVVTNGEVPYFEGIFIKKTPWTREEVQQISQYLKDKQRVNANVFLWNPFGEERPNIYSRLYSLSKDDLKKYYTSLGVNLFPATDDRPFIEHYQQFGKRNLDQQLPAEFRDNEKKKWEKRIPRGDFPYFAILAESALLGLLCLGLPLLSKARRALLCPGFGSYLAYYAALGFGFIAVEICLMKRYALFLGNPAYSLTTILVALLLSAGIGSLLTERIVSNVPKAIRMIIPLIGLALIAEMYISPILFDQLLHLSFPARVAVASLMLFPLGVLMGMPFALGLRVIHALHPDSSERERLVAWAWGVNAYTTVIGSASTVFLALFLGFKAVLLIAVMIYLLGGIALYRRSQLM